MTILAITKTEDKIFIELDKNNLEILMGSLGILTKETVESIARVEKDYQNGRFYILKKPRDLLGNHKAVPRKIMPFVIMN
jgi:hypothetical protein